MNNKPNARIFSGKMGWLCDLEFTNPRLPAYPIINIASNLKLKHIGDNENPTAVLFVRDMSIQKKLLQPGFLEKELAKNKDLDWL